ncbi:hypothetical protein NK718_13520 [Alsobacter sp. SYSU M60028]|uniref:Hypersensitivity response secretion-like HrpJ domain-containing protein n=1 Tax=Alsobacter ponti TaxID=2962936 RepID=A0ABT1LDG0_9HYPH|nr:HrpJ domain-containing protein [Alsobacter ponti]MCP8939540.1 hypothetical protein [Alsobacter ponti]
MIDAADSLRGAIVARIVETPAAAPVAAALQGLYQGERVEVTDDSAKLSEMQEEMGEAVAHRHDRHELKKREVRAGQGASLESLARIADYLDKLPDMPDEAKLKELVERMEEFADLLDRGSSAGGGPSVEDVLSALQEYDPDPTHQFAALEALRREAESDPGKSALQDLLDDARRRFDEPELQREVRAGFAAAQPAHDGALRLELDPAGVREAYRAMLRDTPDAGRLFEALRKMDGLRRIEDVIDLFIEIAGRDMRAAEPSVDSRHLQSTLTELGHLKRMRTVLDGAEGLVRTTARCVRGADLPSAADATAALLTFASKPAVSRADVRSLFPPRLDEPLGLVVWGNGLRDLHAALPDGIPPGPAARAQQTGQLLAFLDELVAAEEARHAASIG